MGLKADDTRPCHICFFFSHFLCTCHAFSSMHRVPPSSPLYTLALICLCDQDDDVPIKSSGGQLSKTAKLRVAGKLIVTSGPWAVLMAIVTIIAVIGLSLNWYPQQHTAQVVRDGIYYTCAVIFIFECILKLLIFGIAGYFRSANNMLDFCLVIINILSIISLFWDALDDVEPLVGYCIAHVPLCSPRLFFLEGARAHCSSRDS